MIPLIALLLSTLAVAISVCAAVAVMRRPVRYISSPVPRHRGPLMQDAARRRQAQAGGSLTIDESTLGRRERIARETAKRMAEQGRHL